MTSQKLNPTISTDANGWRVYDYGSHKKWQKNIAVNVSLVGPNQRTNYSLGGFPDGSTSARRVSGCAYDGTYSGHCSAGVQGTDVYIGAIYSGGTLNYVGVIAVEFTE